MKKSEYLDALKIELNTLAKADVDEILRDQEEYITEAIRSGRDEESVVSALGSPKELAQELKANYQINKATTEEKIVPKFKSMTKAALALCILAPFNLIFIVGPFSGVFGFLIGVWSVAITLLCVAIVGIPVSFFGLFNIPLFSTILFSSLALVGLGILAIVGSFYLTKLFLKVCISYLKWNYKFITGEEK